MHDKNKTQCYYLLDRENPTQDRPGSKDWLSFTVPSLHCCEITKVQYKRHVFSSPYREQG